MSLTLIRRRHDIAIDEPWIRADTWELLAQAIDAPLPELLLDGTFLVRWPDGRTETSVAPDVDQVVKAWAAHGYRWAVVSGKAPRPRAVRGPDQALEDL